MRLGGFVALASSSPSSGPFFRLLLSFFTVLLAFGLESLPAFVFFAGLIDADPFSPFLLDFFDELGSGDVSAGARFDVEGPAVGA